MATIRKTNSDRISIADAKRLILEAAPLETMGHVYAQLDEHGNIDEDAPIDVRLAPDTNTFEAGIDRDFLGACSQLNIQPRNKYRPTFTDYSGDYKQDDYYTITHDEFERYAGLHDMRVVVNPSPATAPETNIQPQAAPVVPAGEAQRPLQRSTAQDAAILDAIREAGYDPLQLPKHQQGKRGIKADMRAALVGRNPLFPTVGTQFDKAWDRLRKFGEIAELG
jgi:hypothetical protein